MRCDDTRSRLASLILSSVFVGACSGDTGKNGSSCTVETAHDGSAVIRCEDGTKAVVPAPKNDAVCGVTDDGKGGKTIKCSDGTSVSVHDGQPGAPGAQGDPGSMGAPGSSGAQGDPGASGQDGTNRQHGANGAAGPSGASSIVVGAGLLIEVFSVTIPSDRMPLVRLQLRDASGRPLDREGLHTEGAVSVSFALAYLPADGEPYVAYDLATVAGTTTGSTPPALASAPQARADTSGVWSAVDPAQGLYDYQMSYALPADYDATKTHTLLAYGSRSFEAKRYVSDAVFDFRPDGNAVQDRREVVTNGACNACHTRLSAHADSVRDVAACGVCHTPDTADPESGNSLDFRRMIHAIHRGTRLPTRGYALVGDGGAVDYASIAFPRPNENCGACHAGAAQGDRHETAFSRDVCGSCHDDVFFGNLADLPAGMTPHSGNPQSSDQFCNLCHARGGPPYPSGKIVDIDRVHLAPHELPVQKPGDVSMQVAPPIVSGSIVSVAGASGPSDHPQVTFSVSVDGAKVTALSDLDHVVFTFAGPTTDYVSHAELIAVGSGSTGSVASTSTPGEITWTSAATLQQIADMPSQATPPRPAIPLSGTWAVGMDAAVLRTAVKPDTSVIANVSYSMPNDVRYFGITDTTPAPRRIPVDMGGCNTCHGALQAHGGKSDRPEQCVLCHDANEDSTLVPAPRAGQTALTASLRASNLIHRIHMGDAGSKPYEVEGRDFGSVRFPDDRRNCAHCHVSGQPALPLPAGLLASFREIIDSSQVRQPGTSTFTGATAAACTGCHDDDSTGVHVRTMSVVSQTDPASIDEACATCHAAGEAYGIDIVHALPP